MALFILYYVDRVCALESGLLLPTSCNINLKLQLVISKDLIDTPHVLTALHPLNEAINAICPSSLHARNYNALWIDFQYFINNFGQLLPALAIQRFIYAITIENEIKAIVIP